MNAASTLCAPGARGPELAGHERRISPSLAAGSLGSPPSTSANHRRYHPLTNSPAIFSRLSSQ